MFGIISFVSLIAYALHFDVHLFLFHCYLWFTSQELWLFDVAKGGEKGCSKSLRKSLTCLEIK